MRWWLFFRFSFLTLHVPPLIQWPIVTHRLLSRKLVCQSTSRYMPVSTMRHSDHGSSSGLNSRKVNDFLAEGSRYNSLYVKRKIIKTILIFKNIQIMTLVLRVIYVILWTTCVYLRISWDWQFQRSTT